MNENTFRIRRIILGILGVSLVLGANFFVQRQLMALKRQLTDEELLYLPNHRLLHHFTAGLRSVVADILWLRGIQYTAREFHSQERKFLWLEHLCNTVVRLDPYFTGAYQIGATLLAAIGNDEGAVKLLQKGLVARPDRWELPLEMAKVFILNRRDEPGAAASASYYLLWTADLAEEKDKEFFTRWAFNLQRIHDLTATGIQIWENVLRTTRDPLMREIAKQKILLLQLRAQAKELTKIVERFKTETGGLPESIEELVRRGYIAQIPVDPLGGSFIMDSDGNVWSTSVLDEDVAALRRFLESALRRFEVAEGRFPSTLEELVEKNYLKKLPKHPYLGKIWAYDPLSGKLEH